MDETYRSTRILTCYRLTLSAWTCWSFLFLNPETDRSYLRLAHTVLGRLPGNNCRLLYVPIWYQITMLHEPQHTLTGPSSVCRIREVGFDVKHNTLQCLCLFLIFFSWPDSPSGPRPPLWGSSITLSEWTRWDSSGRVIGTSQGTLSDNTQHSQETDCHTPAVFKPAIPANERK
jgi:hypothetical protein